jgi:hypothetical protein
MKTGDKHRPALRSFLIPIAMIGLSMATGCGGGSSSSGGGGGTFNQYAGTYVGTITFGGSGRPGATGPTSGPITLEISQQGSVSGNIPEGTGWETCDINGPSVPLAGNTFSMTGTGPCSSPQIARCNVVSHLTGTVSGNMISGTGTHTYDCPSGVEVFSFTATKTAA